MTSKPRGTADLTLTVWLLADNDGTGDGAWQVAKRFARVARERGSVVVVSHEWEWIENPTDASEPKVLRWTVRYRHTCRNMGNHAHDARRFFANALRIGRDDEWAGDVLDVTLHSWKPVPDR